MGMKKKLLKYVAAASSMAVLLFPNAAAAATVVVNPNNMQGWSFVNDNGAGGSGSMVSGPATPPLGQGSAQLEVPAPTDGYALAKAAYQGLDLASITSLQYSTYRSSGGPALAIALQFNIDADSTDGNTAFQGRLVYEPYHTQTVQTGVWQTWNTLNDAAGTGTGNWWFSNGALATATGCSQANPCTWAEVLAARPNAEVHSTLGAVVLKAGSGWTGFVGNVDALKINSDTYDFEPLVGPPTSKDQCKKEGYKRFNNPSFRNQGECIAYVNSHGVPDEVDGVLMTVNPQQKIEFDVDREDNSPDLGTVEYWNYEYQGGTLNYKADVLCLGGEKSTKEARVMFQIPEGYPGLSGLYIVAYTKDVDSKVGEDLYGHAATSDEATARAWCETGAGYAPTMHQVNRGHVEVE